MIAQARRVSFDILQRIEMGRTFSDEALNSPAVAALQPRDRHLATQIVYGTLRWRLSLDHLLSQFSAIPWNEVDAGVQMLLRMSLFQMWRMDRLPDHAVVSDAVDLARQACAARGVPGFVNGMLRNLGRRRPWLDKDFEQGIPRWIQVSLPQWIWDRWTGRFGENVAYAYAVSLNQAPECWVWQKAGAEKKSGALSSAMASDLVPGAWRLSESAEDRSLWVQDEASQLIPHLLGDIRGRRVWDACAAPGGKSAILAGMTGNSGMAVSSDLRPRRVRRMARMLQAQIRTSPNLLAADASRPAPFRALFDAVLADVACSGLGTLRRNPEIKWRMRRERLSELGKTQAETLVAVSRSVRVGGLLLYCTCSTEPEENEQVVDTFLTSQAGFRVIPPSEPPGIGNWLDARGFLSTFPSTRLWDGFFAALMLRFA